MIVILFFVFTLGLSLLYKPCLNGALTIIDDRYILAAKPHFDGTTLQKQGFWYFWRKNLNQHPRLVAFVVNLLNYRWSGFQPRSWHLVNIAIHAFNGALLYQLGSSWWPGQAIAVVAMFLLHPAQVSSVAYISGRSGLLGMTGILAGMLALDARAWWGVIAAVVVVAKTREDYGFMFPFLLGAAWLLVV